MLTEIYKSFNKVSAENFFDSLFEFKFRQSQFLLELKIPFCNSVYHGKNSIRYFAPQIWNSVPFEIRNAATLEDCSRKLKCWKPEECLCQLMSNFVVRISNLTGKRVKNMKESAVSEHLLQCDCTIDLDNFDILTSDTNSFTLHIKESLLIKRDKPVLNCTVKSFPLKLCD